MSAADGREVCTVCTVYEQQLAVRAAQIGKLGNRPPDAVIGRRGQKDCFDLRMRDQLCFRILDRKRTGNREWLDQRCRKEIRRNAEQRAAVADGLVYLAVEQDSAAASDRCAEHGQNALCRAAGQKKQSSEPKYRAAATSASRIGPSPVYRLPVP